MRLTPIVIALALTATAAPAVAATPAEDGKALHDAHCLSCHGTGVYTRSDRRIDSRAGLKAQVKRCARGPAEVDWSGQEVEAVTRYLDNAFYQF